VSTFAERLLATGAVIEMPRHKHLRNGIFELLLVLALVLAIFVIGWGAVLWLAHH
jgi:hypothetical protein